MTTAARGAVDRRLVPIEQSKEVLNRRLGASNILVAARVRGPLGPDVLRGALDALQRRHPRLRSTIEGPDHDLRFRDDHAAAIPLDVRPFSGEPEARAVALAELNRAVDSASCLLRATLLVHARDGADRRVLLLSHHAVADGYSLVELLEDLLRFCARLHEGRPLSGAEVESLRLLPSIHDLMPAHLKGVRGRIGTWLHARRTRARVRRFGARTLPVERLVPLASRTSGAVLRLLDAERVARLRARCEEAGVSAHGMLCAALMFAVARRLPADGPAGIPVICRTSVSVRQKLRPPVDRKDLGLFASFLLSYHHIREDSTLDGLASEVLEQLWLGYRGGDMFRGLVRNMKNTDAATRGRVPVTVFVTNLDEPGIELEHGPFRIEEVFGLPAGAAFPGVLGLASVTVAGRASLAFFFSEPALSEATVEAVADDVVRSLDRAAAGECRFAEVARG
jgi:hypothetical protein